VTILNSCNLAFLKFLVVPSIDSLCWYNVVCFLVLKPLFQGGQNVGFVSYEWGRNPEAIGVVREC
jgi:hypothetical protein